VPDAPAFDLLAEGRLHTARLSLDYLHTRPRHTDTARLLVLGGSNYDLRLKRGVLASPLPEQFEMITYAPRGIGRSDCPQGDWTMADYAADALAVLDAAGWDRAMVIGESFGGMTALHLALAAPGRVSCMVLASATAGGAGGASHDIARFLALPRDDAARAALIVQDRRNADLMRNDPEAFATRLSERLRFEIAFAESSIATGGYPRLLAARAGHDVWDMLPLIPTPTLVIAGRHDDQAPPAAQRKMADRMPRADYLEQEGGHGLLFAGRDLLEGVCRDWIVPRLASAPAAMGQALAHAEGHRRA
jgi:3-oxoadipate enol-lactonase